jgi:hypothetical protein
MLLLLPRNSNTSENEIASSHGSMFLSREKMNVNIKRNAEDFGMREREREIASRNMLIHLERESNDHGEIKSM